MQNAWESKENYENLEPRSTRDKNDALKMESENVLFYCFSPWVVASEVSVEIFNHGLNTMDEKSDQEYATTILKKMKVDTY